MARTGQAATGPERVGPRAVREPAVPARWDDAALRTRIDTVLNRHPAVGLAVGIVRDGSLQLFDGRGFADIASGVPIGIDTVFRIGSITKVVTAITVMPLREEGLVDLDAPADEYLRSYQLVPARPGLGLPTLRHLLTHTSGIPEARHLGDLFHLKAGPFEGRPLHLSVPFGDPLPSPAEYYRGGLRVVAQPGTVFAYSNHGFATLGQIIEDVTGTPLDRWFDERIFRPLGMRDTGLVRSAAIGARLATGYTLGRRGAQVVPDRDWSGPAAGGLYSTPGDIARFAAALTRGGADGPGSVLRPASLAEMVETHFRPDPRIRGWGDRGRPRRPRRTSPGRARRDPPGLQLPAPDGPRRRYRPRSLHQRVEGGLPVDGGRVRRTAARSARRSRRGRANRRRAPSRDLGRHLRALPAAPADR